jgi:ubiquinone/menaquinone biosynthesis C-methylase UbiE
MLAVELSSAMIDGDRPNTAAPPAERLELRVADAASLPFEDYSFELLAPLDTPIHLNEAARVLDPGGYLIVASGQGSANPYRTPNARLRNHCRRHSLVPGGPGKAEAGSWFLARREPRSPA